MGRPKALVEIDGVAMAGRVAAALEGVGAEAVALVGGDASWGRALDLVVVPDRWPGEGPLGGLATALLAAGDAADLAVVAACDQPWLTVGALEQLVDALRSDPDATVAVAVVDGRRVPFPVVWRTSEAARLAALVESGERRADAGFADGSVAPVELDAAVVADVDTPADVPPPDRSPAAPAGNAATGPVHSVPVRAATLEPPVDIPEIDIAEAARRHAAGTPVFDVREPDEYVEGHVPGAPLVPLGTVADRVDEFPTSGEVLIVCKMGGRSRKAAEHLRAQGIDAVNIAGGTMGWIEAGHAVVTGDEPGS